MSQPMSEELCLREIQNTVTKIENEMSLNEMMKIQWKSLCFHEDAEELTDKLLVMTADQLARTNALQSLVKSIFGQLFLGDQYTDSETVTERESVVFERLHECLKSYISNFPLASEKIYRGLKSSFPFHSQESRSHAMFVMSFLQCSDYVHKADRRRIFKAVIDKLFNLDINFQLRKKRIEEMIFKMDEDTNIKHSTPEISHAVTVTRVFIEFITSSAVVNGDYNEEKGLDLFENIVPAFAKIVFGSQSTSSVQFVLFGLLNLDESLIESFIGRMWGFISLQDDLSFSKTAACTAMYYVTSLLVSSTKSTQDLRWEFVRRASDFLNEYMVEHDEGVSDRLTDVEILKHQLFHAIFQSFASVIIASHYEFPPAMLKIMKLFKIQKIITSNLNPLLVCPSYLSDSFSSVCSQLQIAACSQVTMRNQRMYQPWDMPKSVSESQIWLPFENCPPRILPVIESHYKGTGNHLLVLKSSSRSRQPSFNLSPDGSSPISPNFLSMSYDDMGLCATMGCSSLP